MESKEQKKYLMAIQVNIRPGKPAKCYQEVYGTPLIIPGYEQFQFFYRVNSFNDDFEIIEITTGLLCTYHQPTIDSAIEDIQGRIAKLGVEHTKETIKKNQIPKSKRLPEVKGL
jgi:cobalamin biosynthesis Co2+ chelatase CbiK